MIQLNGNIISKVQPILGSSDAGLELINQEQILPPNPSSVLSECQWIIILTSSGTSLLG